MAEFHDRLLKQFKRHVMLIGIGLVAILVTNLYMMWEVFEAENTAKLSVVVANQSAYNAEKALNQSQLNAIEIYQHANQVIYHANVTKQNGEAILNNTELLLQLHEKIP